MKDAQKWIKRYARKKNKFELAKNSKNKCNNFFFERQEDEPSK